LALPSEIFLLTPLNIKLVGVLISEEVDKHPPSTFVVFIARIVVFFTSTREGNSRKLAL